MSTRRPRGFAVSTAVVLLLALIGRGAMPPADAQVAGEPPTQFQIATETSLLEVHPRLQVALPDALQIDVNYARAAIGSTPTGEAMAGPAHVGALGLLPFLGLPALPPDSQPSCAAYFPAEPSEAQCVGPNSEFGGDVHAAIANGEVAVTGGDFTNPTGIGARAVAHGATFEMTAVTAGAGQSTAHVRSEEDRWIADSSTTIGFVDIAGWVRLENVRSAVHAESAATADSATASRKLTIGSSRIFGQEVRLTSEGIEVVEDGTTPAQTLEQVLRTVISLVGGQVPPVLPGVDPAPMLAELLGELALSERSSQLLEDLNGTEFGFDDVANVLETVLSDLGVRIFVLPPNEPVIEADGTRLRADTGGVGVQLDFSKLGVEQLGPGNGMDLIFAQSEVSMNVSRPSTGSTIPISAPSDSSQPAGATDSDGVDSSTAGGAELTGRSIDPSVDPPTATEVGEVSSPPRVAAPEQLGDADEPSAPSAGTGESVLASGPFGPGSATCSLLCLYSVAALLSLATAGALIGRRALDLYAGG